MSDSDTNPKKTESGAPLYHHRESEPWAAAVETEHLEDIVKHIEKHLGPVANVFHEIVSDTVHIDLHIVAPNKENPVWRVVTSGMSALPMKIPSKDVKPEYAELMITLPGYWKLDQESFKDDKWYWPLRMLKALALLPHKCNTWLGYGHTVGLNESTLEPFGPDTKQCCALVMPSPTAPEEFLSLTLPSGKEIFFLCLIPIYEDEMNLKLRVGTDALLDKFDKARVLDVIDPSRKSALRKKLFGLF